MANSVHIVDTTHANVGELVAILSSVGTLECTRTDGEGCGNPGAEDGRRTTTVSCWWLAFYRQVLASSGWYVSGLRPTAPS